jgi:hypothetical protein
VNGWIEICRRILIVSFLDHIQEKSMPGKKHAKVDGTSIASRENVGVKGI